MSVSSEARPARAKATPVSRERFTMPAGYGGAWLRRPWAVAGPGRASRRRAERSSRRGRRAGGPPPTGAQSSPARRVRPNGARNTSGAASNKLNREFRLRRPRAAAGPGRSSIRRAEPHISDQAPLVWRAPEGPEGARGPGCGGRGRWRGLADTTQHRMRRRCGGRRRVRRARAGFEIDHSEPQARVWRSRGRPGPTAPGTPAAPGAPPGPRQTALTLRRRRARGVPCS